MKYRIIMVSGAVLDFNPGQDFKLHEYVHGMRSMGFILSNNIYVRADLVAAIIQIDEQAELAVQFTVPQQPKGTVN